MTARNFWLVVFIWCLLLGLLVTCSGVCGGEGAGVGASGGGDVDLEAVTDLYKTHVQSGAEDLTTFEAAVNSKGVYKGEGHVRTELAKDGAVVGYVDQDGDGHYGASADQLVFKIEADQPRKQLIASDRYQRHYRIGAGDIFTFYLLSRMFDRHRSYYGGWHDYRYRSYVRRGYYRSLPSRRFGSRSWGSGGRSWGRGGGWGGGK